MKKLKKLKLAQNLTFVSEDEMKKILGGGYGYTGKADCVGKKDGDPCNHPRRKYGVCRHWPYTTDLVCWGYG